jgi:hypothetical protein
MRAAKALMFAMLFVTMASGQTEWKQFTNPSGNFSVLFPGTPQEQASGAPRHLHLFGAKTGAESYGLAYADYASGTNWAEAINSERDSMVNSFGGKVVEEQRTSIEGFPGKWIRFVGRDTSGELAIYFVGHRLYLLDALTPKGARRPTNFSQFLNSFRLLSKPKP